MWNDKIIDRLMAVFIGAATLTMLALTVFLVYIVVTDQIIC